MNSTLSLKCLPYVNGSKINVIRGVYHLTRRFKSDEVSSNDSNDNTNSKKNAVDKLNELLKTMKKGNETDITTKTSKHDLAQPRQLSKKTQKQQNIDEIKHNKKLGEKLANAATSIAQTIGGDTKKTESELLNLLRIYSTDQDDSSEKKSRFSVQLSDLLSGMKIDRNQPKTNFLKYADIDKAQRVKELINKSTNLDLNLKVRRFKKPMDNYIPINLFSSEPLDIFKDIHLKKNDLTLHTWDRLHEKSLKLAVTHPPKNIYEQMIIWTEQGKLWKFPINNEQGIDDENKVFFAEHVFLEPLIDEWCPKKGPIRHFMELVCVGLSKNPFLLIEEKKDHINWFRQYFFEKNQLLKEVGAFEIKSLPQNVKDYYKPSIPNE